MTISYTRREYAKQMKKSIERQVGSNISNKYEISEIGIGWKNMEETEGD
jgi:hypothetical protein